MSADPIPRIAPGMRLQWEPAQQAHVLLYPEGMVRLNRSAGEILSRCDGATPLASIVDSLEHAFQAPGLTPQVQDFLAIARRQGWVVDA